MTPTQRAAMEQSLAVLDALCETVPSIQPTSDALRAALAEPMDPVGFGHFFSGELIDAVSTGFKSRMEQNNDMSVYDTPLYTTPQLPAPAVGLTVSEILGLIPDDIPARYDRAMIEFARAAIAAHEAKK
jgi:hypothetical protein